MKKFSLLSVVLAMIAGAADARAGDINGPAMAGLVLNNTSPDADLYGLGQFVGVSTDVLHTNTTDTSTGFTESLTGTYAGQALSVNYVGDSSAFPTGGPVTWTSTGTYGTEAWNGSGSATFTFPTASTFQIAYSSSLSVGSNTESLNITISGADNGTWLYFTTTTGTMTINGVNFAPARDTQGTLLAPYVGGLGYDDYEVNGRVTITSIYCIEECNLSPTYPYPPTLIVTKGHISFVPEPSSLVLASFGALGLFVTYVSRRGLKIGV